MNEDFDEDYEDLKIKEAIFEYNQRSKDLWEREKEEYLAEQEEALARQYVENYPHLVGDKNYRRGLFSKFSKLDSWLLYSEALALVHCAEPIYFSRVAYLCSDYSELQLPQVKAAAGVSLKVINQSLDVESWRVKPEDFLKWAYKKGWDLPPDLLEVMGLSLQRKSFKVYSGHPNAEHHAQRRESVLKAALAVLVAYPDKCRIRGKVSATAIASLIEQKSPIWFEDNDVPLSDREVKKLINGAINTLR